MNSATLHKSLLGLFLLLMASISRLGEAGRIKTVLPPVTLSQDSVSYSLANGFITARISKSSGDLYSLKFKNLEMLGTLSGHPGGYWSHTPGRNARTVDRISIDPTQNNGERAEISIKGFYKDSPLGSGPGGSAVADIEIRYSLGREDQGIYTYSIFEHKPEYPPTSIGEARFAAKLNGDIFDYMTIDSRRNKQMITAEDWNQGTQLNMKEARRMNTGLYKGEAEHKYDYSAIQFDTPAFGWSSTQKHVGLWFVNPTIEYLSGGATKLELTAHRDVNTGAAPTILNYWRGSHYGGSSCVINQGEAWNKVIGPFLIYCNAAPDPETMWKDALKQSANEADKWPYSWVSGVDYPTRDQRGIVSGQILLHDLQAPNAQMNHLLVGLSVPDYMPSGGRQKVDWQTDAKYYEFWVHGDDQGRFTIPNIRPGTYTLHAIADGVLGEFTQTTIKVSPGKNLDLGQLTWQPVRYGRQLWEIGIPDRSAQEFLHGNDYWHWGLYNKYPEEFPNDVHFVIGKSDLHKDWNYCQTPRGDGKGTTWSISFDLSEQPRGKGILRLALAGVSARHIQITVNDVDAGDTGPLQDTATIRRDAIRGYWSEHDISFDASLMKPGTNVLKLIIPPAGVMYGVEYDYLRLELAP